MGLTRFREALLKYEEETGRDLIKEEVISLAVHAKVLLGISDQLRRMDRMMISSRCKTIGRLDLVYTCVENLVMVFVELRGIEPLLERLVKCTNAGTKTPLYTEPRATSRGKGWNQRSRTRSL